MSRTSQSVLLVNGIVLFFDLINKIHNRTRASFSWHFIRGTVVSRFAQLSDNLTVEMGAGLSSSVTEKQKTIWMTTAKPLIVKDVMDQAEIGTDVSLNSDIRDYDSPRLPSYMTVGVRVGYTFGEKPVLN
jgi:hypothetical protein